MTTAAPGRGRGEQGEQNGQGGQNRQGGHDRQDGQDGQNGQDGQDPLIPPDPTSLEAWMRQVLGLAGARASAFPPPLPTPPPLRTPPPLPALPPLPSTGPGHPGRSADADGPDPGGHAK